MAADEFNGIVSIGDKLRCVRSNGTYRLKVGKEYEVDEVCLRRSSRFFAPRQLTIHDLKVQLVGIGGIHFNLTRFVNLGAEEEEDMSYGSVKTTKDSAKDSPQIVVEVIGRNEDGSLKFSSELTFYQSETIAAERVKEFIQLGLKQDKDRKFAIFQMTRFAQAEKPPIIFSTSW